MIEQFFTWLTLAMNDRFEIALLASMGWGVMSVILSPCHLSSIPLVIGYLSSQGREGMKRPYSLSLVFATGILITIALIGAITASAGRMMGDVGMWGNLVVASVFIVVSLSLMDVISFSWGKILPSASIARGWQGALILGLFFGIGLGPCTFAFMAPVLGVVFSVASAHPAQAIALMAAFGIGHCAVIVASGGAAGAVQRYLNWTEQSRGAKYLKRIAGGLVLLGGIYYISAVL